MTCRSHVSSYFCDHALGINIESWWLEYQERFASIAKFKAQTSRQIAFVFMFWQSLSRTSEKIGARDALKFHPIHQNSRVMETLKF